MKVSQLIEALQTANKMFKKKHGKEMEIFDFQFNDDEHDSKMSIHGCGEVVYDSGSYHGCCSATGKKPHETILIEWPVVDGKLDDRSIEFHKDDEEC